MDKTVTTRIKIGNGQIVQATRKSTLVIKTKNRIRNMKEVMLVLGLDENLLSVGQMIQHDYFLSGVAIFEDRQLEYHVETVLMIGNRCFPLLTEDMNRVVRKVIILLGNNIGELDT